MDGTLLNAFILLSLCIVAIFLLSLYLKKYSQNKAQQLGAFESKVLSKIPLSRNSSLFVVKVGERSFLIGSSDKTISLISELTSNNNYNVTKSEFPNPSYLPQKQTKKNLSNEPITSNDNLSFKSFLKSTFSRGN
ncbi:MAG: flagellar biosynthetic protein FliO [Candidatus Kapaibacteriota bacterium]